MRVFFFLFQNNKKSNKNLVNCRREGQITKNIIIFDFRIKHHSFFKIEFFCFFISFEEGAAVLQEIDWGGRIKEKTTFLWAVISKSIQQMRSILLLPKYDFLGIFQNLLLPHKSMLCLLDLPELWENAEERYPGSLDKCTPGTPKMDWTGKWKQMDLENRPSIEIESDLIRYILKKVISKCKKLQ